MSFGLEAAQIVCSEPASLILGLEDIAPGDAALVGQKAYRLAVLFRNGFERPSRFLHHH